MESQPQNSINFQRWSYNLYSNASDHFDQYSSDYLHNVNIFSIKDSCRHRYPRNCVNQINLQCCILISDFMIFSPCVAKDK